VPACCRRYPSIPHRVHLGEFCHVGDPDIGGEQFTFVGAGLRQKTVDLRKNAFGLLAHALTLGRVGDDTGEIDGIAVDYGLAHARPGVETLDCHGVSFQAGRLFI
jgi:hypothetical protein